MTFTLKNNKNEILCTGTKQDCMYYIKHNALNRKEVTLAQFRNTPVPHYTSPIEEVAQIKKPFYKRIFD